MTIYKSESWDSTQEVRYFISYESMMRYHRQKDPVKIRLVDIYGLGMSPSLDVFNRLLRVEKRVGVFVYFVSDEQTGVEFFSCFKVTEIKVI